MLARPLRAQWSAGHSSRSSRPGCQCSRKPVVGELTTTSSCRASSSGRLDARTGRRRRESTRSASHRKACSGAARPPARSVHGPDSEPCLPLCTGRRARGREESRAATPDRESKAITLWRVCDSDLEEHNGRDAASEDARMSLPQQQHSPHSAQAAEWAGGADGNRLDRQKACSGGRGACRVTRSLSTGQSRASHCDRRGEREGRHSDSDTRPRVEGDHAPLRCAAT